MFSILSRYQILIGKIEDNTNIIFSVKKMDQLFDEVCTYQWTMKDIILFEEMRYIHGHSYDRTNPKQVESYKKLLEQLYLIQSKGQMCFILNTRRQHEMVHCIFQHIIISYYPQNHQCNAQSIFHNYSLFTLQVLKLTQLPDQYNYGHFERLIKRIQSIEDSHKLQMELSIKELEIERCEIHKCKEHHKKEQKDFEIEKTKLKSDKKYLCELYEEINDKLSSKREEFEKTQQKMDNEKQAFEKEKSTFTSIQSLFYEVVEKEKHNLMTERKAFEQEKLTLEKELAKYRNIVSNCQREIKAYGL